MFSNSQEHLEKLRQHYEAQVKTMQEGFKQGVESLSQNQKVAAEGYAKINESIVKSSQAVLESGVHALTTMRNCRSPKDVYEVQSHFAKTSVEELKKHVANVTEHSTHIATHVWDSMQKSHNEETAHSPSKPETKAKAS